MKPTKLMNLASIAFAVGIVGFFVIQLMVGNGLPAPTTAINIILLQPGLALILFLSAIPMLRYRAALKKFLDNKGERPKPVDPTYAIRSLALAKSIALTGSVFSGWHSAIVVYQLLAPQTTSLLNPALGVAGALIMISVGLIVENLFRIPPDRDGDAA
ncbi:MAG: hypothetical protein RLZZ56_409 [Actinomycetota bacterium]